jgi:hypothetical protein
VDRAVIHFSIAQTQTEILCFLERSGKMNQKTQRVNQRSARERSASHFDPGREYKINARQYTIPSHVRESDCENWDSEMLIILQLPQRV